MNRTKAASFYRKALAYINENHPDELKWVRNLSPDTFQKMDVQGFPWEYCWVVYASGFRVSTVAKKFDALMSAFHEFNLEKLNKMKSVKAALAVINNQRKAAGFLKGAKSIHQEGFLGFKDRLKDNAPTVLQELPYIGPTTWRHLARNIGLMDVSKDDVHLKRLMKAFNAPSVDALTSYLATTFQESEGVVDLVLWRSAQITKAG